MINPVVVGLAAMITRRESRELFDPMHHQSAVGALIGIFSRQRPAFERQVVKRGFTRYSQFGAGAPPLGTVRLEATGAASSPGERDNVSDFVAKGALNLRFSNIDQPRIEFDPRGANTGGACGCLETGVPGNNNSLRRKMAAQAGEPVAG